MYIDIIDNAMRDRAVRTPVLCNTMHVPVSGPRYTGNVYISVPLFQVGPPGHFKHISITTPAVTALTNYYR